MNGVRCAARTRASRRKGSLRPDGFGRLAARQMQAQRSRRRSSAAARSLMTAGPAGTRFRVGALRPAHRWTARPPPPSRRRRARLRRRSGHDGACKPSSRSGVENSFQPCRQPASVNGTTSPPNRTDDPFAPPSPRPAASGADGWRRPPASAPRWRRAARPRRSHSRRRPWPAPPGPPARRPGSRTRPCAAARQRQRLQIDLDAHAAGLGDMAQVGDQAVGHVDDAAATCSRTARAKSTRGSASGSGRPGPRSARAPAPAHPAPPPGPASRRRSMPVTTTRSPGRAPARADSPALRDPAQRGQAEAGRPRRRHRVAAQQVNAEPA